ncbi:MAG TPA: tetratricopeptide repeat protein [Pyrinomonadaceae bacterium]|nr:tetratricopeptide repeat protein [Pyrinomonadaceae bacterium]
MRERCTTLSRAQSSCAMTCCARGRFVKREGQGARAVQWVREMKSRPCPSCGANAVPEARFCRQCGAPLKAGGALEGEEPVSPLAQTVPLKGEGRATDGLSAEDERRGTSRTSRVDRAEIDDILRRVEAEFAQDGDEKKEQVGVEASATTPQTTTLAAERVEAAKPDDSPEASSSVAQVVEPSQKARSSRRWIVAVIALLCVAVVAVVLAFVLSRKSGPTQTAQQPASAPDQKQLAKDKLAEAETLLESGEFNHAVDVLHEAVKLDPSNAEAHMRLGNALERIGSRAEAIEEYKAVAEKNPDDTSAWHALASAQTEEKLYKDAAESYRRLVSASGNNVDDETWLAYGDALRLAGEMNEARTAYQKIAASNSAPIAQSARQHLAEMGSPDVAVNTAHPSDTRTTEQQQPQAREPETATPKPSPATAPRATPASTVATSANPIDYDSYYFQAMNVVNGREPKQMERAELLRALALFQRAALGGTHRAEAQRYAERLGKEYDKRKKW